jgi:hypothetical protein
MATRCGYLCGGVTRRSAEHGVDWCALCGQTGRGSANLGRCAPAAGVGQVADVELMPTMSQELQSVEWLDGATDQPILPARNGNY